MSCYCEHEQLAMISCMIYIMYCVFFPAEQSSRIVPAKQSLRGDYEQALYVCVCEGVSIHVHVCAQNDEFTSSLSFFGPFCNLICSD